jgi:hypothetical protein
MLSFVVVLLGSISLTRLPVDLMPDISFPSLTVRVNYPGVGPLEMEELVTRPIEQAVSAVAGLEQINSTSSEGSSMVRLNFVWGTDLNEAADEVRTRVDRVRGRLPNDADPRPSSSSTRTPCPSWASASKATTTSSRCARSPERPVARGSSARRRGGGHDRRRPAPPDPRRAVEGEDHGAQPVGGPRGADPPHREPEHPARRDRRGRPHVPAAQPRPVPTSTRSATPSC